MSTVFKKGKKMPEKNKFSDIQKYNFNDKSSFIFCQVFFKKNKEMDSNCGNNLSVIFCLKSKGFVRLNP